jgi:hypothetical protein
MLLELLLKEYRSKTKHKKLAINNVANTATSSSAKKTTNRSNKTCCYKRIEIKPIKKYRWCKKQQYVEVKIKAQNKTLKTILFLKRKH